MKHLLIFIVVMVGLFFITSCETTKPIVEDDVKVSTQVGNEPEVILTPKVEAELDPEYSRSIGGLSGEISYDTFQNDKSEILAIIAQLDETMRNRDYNSWRTYLTETSLSYWSNRVNLQVLSTKLPDNDFILRNLNDYFTRMFIPSRMGRVVNEIRYISPTAVKAVQVQGDTDILYYNFVKLDGKWLVELQKL